MFLVLINVFEIFYYNSNYLMIINIWSLHKRLHNFNKFSEMQTFYNCKFVAIGTVKSAIAMFFFTLS